MERQSGLSIVGRFAYLHEADLAKALLESEQIRSWLLDENQIRHRWHLGAALGGVKLAVAPNDAERAADLLSQDFSEAIAAIPEQGLAGHPDEVCPRCGSSRVSESSQQRWPGPLQWIASLLFLFLGALVPRRSFEVKRQCADCGCRWSQRETR